MLNWVVMALVVGAALVGGYRGTMGEVSQASIDASRGAVELALGLVGQMALWLGVAQVLQDAGVTRGLARALKPVMLRLFPDIPPEHPAMGAMILNIVANMLGLANAATPFGIKAMIELNRLNRRPGVATNAMVLFLTINTSGVAVLPTGVIAIRAALGASDPAGVFFPSILATAASTTVGVLVCLALARLPAFSLSRYPEGTEPEAAPEEVAGLDAAEAELSRAGGFHPAYAITAAAVGLLLIGELSWSALSAPPGLSGFQLFKQLSSQWILPLLLVSVLLFGFSRRVAVYESMVKGAKQGFSVAVTIIPFLVIILVAIGMFRASGAMDVLVSVIGQISAPLGVPAETLPMALIRPLSGSGATAVMMESLKHYGPDSFIGFVVSVMQGSTETTFYVLAVYLGAVRVEISRHAVFSCLAADLTGAIAAVGLSHLFF